MNQIWKVEPQQILKIMVNFIEYVGILSLCNVLLFWVSHFLLKANFKTDFVKNMKEGYLTKSAKYDCLCYKM